MSLRGDLLFRAKKLKKLIALPESVEPRILSAIDKMLVATNLRFFVFGEQDFFKRALKNYDEKRIVVCDMQDKIKNEKLAEYLYELRKNKGMTIDIAREQIKNPMIYSTILLNIGEIDGITCGAITSTADVLRPLFQIVKTKPGITSASSAIMFDVPKSHKYGDRGPILFADCSVMPYPNSENLKDIALASCETYKKLAGGKPVVAFLSYSTKSGEEQKDESIVRIKEAIKMVKKLAPGLDVDGEMQLDAALDRDVAKVKCPRSKVAGRANVFIFPDINAANIAYKTASRLAGFDTVGVILQGVNRPANDLSRGADVDEICSMICVTALS